MKHVALVCLILLTGCLGLRHSRSISSTDIYSSDACRIMEARKQIGFREAQKAMKSKHRLNRSWVGYPRQEPEEVLMVVNENTNPEYKPSTVIRPSEVIILEGELVEKLQPFEKPETPSISPLQKRAPELGQKSTEEKLAPVTKKNLGRFTYSVKEAFAIGVAGLLAMSLIRLREKRMLRISKWGLKNPGATKVLIGAANTALTGGALIAGNYLYNEGISIPGYVEGLGLGALAGACIFYPSSYVSQHFPAFSYFQRKAFDVTLATAGTALMFYGGNHYECTTNPVPMERVVYSTSLPNSYTTISFAKKDFSKPPISAEQDNKSSKASKIVATVLVSILFSFLFAGVAALSCYLTCNGQTGLAFLLAAGGGGLLVWALIAIIRAIHKGPKKQKTVTPTGA